MKKIASLILLCLSGWSNAQNRPDTIPEETGVLFGKTRIELTDARRIPTEPVIETPEIKTPTLDFTLSLKPGQAPNTIQMPAAERMPKSATRVLHQNYLRLGYGSNLSPLADVYIAMPGKSGLLNFNYHFLAANGPAFQDFSQHRGRVSGKKYYSKGNLEAGFRFDRDGIHYYGYNRETYVPADKKAVRQYYQYLGGNLAFESNKAGRNKPYYRLASEYYHFSDRHKQTENHFRLGGTFRFFVEKNLINTEVAYQLQQFSGANDTFTRHFVDLSPYYTLKRKQWQLNLGFNTTLVSETNSNVVFKFFPRVEGSYEIEKDLLSVFGEISGNVQKNSFQGYAAINPFLSPGPNLNISVQNFHFQAGIKGKLSGNTGFVARVLYQNTQDMPLFVTDTNELRSFRIIQDDMELIRINAGLTHQYSEKFRFGLDFNYNHYSPQVQQFAWLLPAVELKVNSTYNMGDKILLGLDLFVLGSRKALVAYSNSEPATLKPLADLNLSLDYRWKKQISAFLKLNNLLGQHYQIWYLTPVYSFNLHAGLAIGF